MRKFYFRSVLCRGFLLMSLWLAACNAEANVPTPTAPPNLPQVVLPIGTPSTPSTATPVPTPTPLPTPFRVYYDANAIPTPDVLKPIKERGIITTTYTVQRGDTLGAISVNVNVDSETLRLVNGLTKRQADRLRTGTQLLVPQDITLHAPDLKLIPDAELVNSPTAIGFDVSTFAAAQRGYLANYTEEVAGFRLTGAQVVQRVADQFSVHPRLLLAALEYNAGWVSTATPVGDALLYPLGWRRTDNNSLYIQLTWAAVRLNEGYYGWRLDNRYITKLDDNVYIFVGNGINAGTAGLQNYLGAISTSANFTQVLGVDGFIRTYQKLFGSPWQFDIGPLVPNTVQQPTLQLPWARGEVWYFSGGPHLAWARGTPWGALDFAPASTQGCMELFDWVRASAAGRIVRSFNGEVAQSLDPRQDERAGWSVLYMHVGSNARATAGAWLNTGDPLGHPSCEGGVAPAAHLHIARKYNGEWLNADGAVPFVLSGWRASESPREYDGYLRKDQQTREACECKVNAKNGVGW